MTTDRDITWDGFYNARDLGGLPTTDGHRTTPGALVRSAGPFLVTDDGWRAAYDAGIRTVIDLREPDETAGAAPPPGIARQRVALDDEADTEFWGEVPRGHSATPLYYQRFLVGKAARCAAAVTAVAQAQPGGVVFHCASGRDRTGLLTLLLLTLAKVEPAAIVADYELSFDRLPPLYAALGREDEGPAVRRLLAEHGTDAPTTLRSILDGFDAPRYLLDAGVAPDDLAAARTRLRGAPRAAGHQGQSEALAAGAAIASP